mmetsp:Transcript_61371/g.194287  ORF Transcript_61371/g.194287 Transcript_61371/m.194287 type:complete len:273 (+) Transcript_61371:231-1049(+)
MRLVEEMGSMMGLVFFRLRPRALSSSSATRDCAVIPWSLRQLRHSRELNTVVRSACPLWPSFSSFPLQTMTAMSCQLSTTASYSLPVIKSLWELRIPPNSALFTSVRERGEPTTCLTVILLSFPTSPALPLCLWFSTISLACSSIPCRISTSRATGLTKSSSSLLLATAASYASMWGSFMSFLWRRASRCSTGTWERTTTSVPGPTYRSNSMSMSAHPSLHPSMRIFSPARLARPAIESFCQWKRSQSSRYVDPLSRPSLRALMTALRRAWS